ncbi:MAG: nucleotidyl transferase AbiEii/AbiGii toxin family protein [Treponema sp.]|nr:nucleotidyl transferase AbiEii/AbiGii toxin family protein [Treponema sp.]
MNIINNCGTRFFLTGGTALSRGYYNHRYSDDLDFFVNDDADYAEQIRIIFSKLKENGFSWSSTVDFISTPAFTTLKVKRDKSEVLLKLDFVNDVAAHFGEIIKTEIFDRTDSIRNMLSNKLTALFRYAAKDVADIREIALRETINWKQAIQDAQQKEAGVELTIAGDILRGMPQSEFETIAWTKKPDWKVFCDDINRIVFDMLTCR